MLPLLALVLAIGSGARTLAGEEEAGRLELLFAYPVRWRDGVLAKGFAVAIELSWSSASFRSSRSWTRRPSSISTWGSSGLPARCSRWRCSPSPWLAGGRRRGRAAGPLACDRRSRRVRGLRLPRQRPVFAASAGSSRSAFSRASGGSVQSPLSTGVRYDAASWSSRSPPRSCSRRCAPDRAPRSPGPLSRIDEPARVDPLVSPS